MKAAGPKQAIESSSTLLPDDVEAAVFALPKGGFMRLVARRTAIGGLRAAAASAVAATRHSDASGDEDKPPKQLLVALTSTELVLLEARAPLFGAPRPQAIWRRLPRGSYQVTTAGGKVVQRFTVRSGDAALELEAKILGLNRPNAEAIDAIVASSAADGTKRSSARLGRTARR
jgi:hypothetical protein